MMAFNNFVKKNKDPLSKVPILPYKMVNCIYRTSDFSAKNILAGYAVFFNGRYQYSNILTNVCMEMNFQIVTSSRITHIKCTYLLLKILIINNVKTVRYGI